MYDVTSVTELAILAIWCVCVCLYLCLSACVPVCVCYPNHSITILFHNTILPKSFGPCNTVNLLKIPELFNSYFSKFRKKYALFCLCLAEIRVLCEFGGILIHHFLESSVNKLADTGCFLVMTLCIICRYHVSLYFNVGQHLQMYHCFIRCDYCC